MASGAGSFPIKRLLYLVLFGGLLCGGVYFGLKKYPVEGSVAEPQRIKMGGTSVAFFMMDQWRSTYAKEKGIKVVFDSTGSTKGINDLIDQKFAIAFTHAPVSSAQLKDAKAKGGEVVHIPVVLCAVVPIYNVKELEDKPPVKFTGEVLADIFLGTITQWNDPALVQLNPDLKLPATKISVVHREDSSGTTLIFADYLHETSPSWQKKIGGVKSEVQWPVGVGMQRNAGVALHVKETEGAIGYVDLLHAISGKISYGALENKDKTAFIHAEPDNILAAAQAISGEIPEDLTFKLINKSGKDSYPISGAVWAVCYQKGPASQQKMISDFLTWVTHEGQIFAKDRTYAPLPAELVNRVEKRLQLIQASK